jgi:hypothetical protein|tara:strand:- start:4112 stop:4291 length:180 start_codon:yes stop_codon:yes gene_type:complete
MTVEPFLRQYHADLLDEGFVHQGGRDYFHPETTERGYIQVANLHDGKRIGFISMGFDND